MIKRTAAPDIRGGCTFIQIYVFSSLRRCSSPCLRLKCGRIRLYHSFQKASCLAPVFPQQLSVYLDPSSLSIPLLLLRELFSICLAGVDPGGIGCLVEDKALAAEDDRSGC